jgi:dynein assembly factor 1
MTNLRALNLTDNLIQKIEGLECLHSLETLQLKRNRIGKFGGLDDALGLLQCPSLTVVDLSDNFIEDEAVLDELWVKMPKIAVIYFQNNGAIKKIKNYRKTLISRIPTLKYLDDRPVFDEDRVAAEAF